MIISDFSIVTRLELKNASIERLIKNNRAINLVSIQKNDCNMGAKSMYAIRVFNMNNEMDFDIIFS
jgi:hypothetical protein